MRFRMWITMLLLGLVYGFFIWFLFEATGGSLLPMALIAGGLALFQFFFSDKLVLKSMRAKVVSPEEAPELHAMVEHLASRAGIPKPHVAVSQMAVPNAFASGRNQKSATVTVTTGLMTTLTKEELEAVLAHELSHIKTKDVVVMTYASFFSVVASTLLSILFWSSLFGGMGRNREGGGGLMMAYIVVLLVWVASQLLVSALSRYREFAADRGAAMLTGQPMALASALQRISSQFSRVPKDDLRKAETLNAFFIMPAIGDSIANLFSTHPSLDRRVARLREMQRELSLA
ncbi:MAG: zinc metalloprotease HtpX [Dehalococcoidia bacterium]